MIKISKVFFFFKVRSSNYFPNSDTRCHSYFVGEITVDRWNYFWFDRKEVTVESTNTKFLLANAAMELYLETKFTSSITKGLQCIDEKTRTSLFRQVFK